jgi:hypothetical protein
MNNTVLVVEGIVMPAKWDENGNVVTVSIHAFDEAEYLIENYDFGRKLLKLLRKQVVVRGILTEKDGKQAIRVSDFSVLDGADDRRIVT